jgi:cytochrome c-type biogenesis protein CcmH
MSLRRPPRRRMTAALLATLLLLVSAGPALAAGGLNLLSVEGSFMCTSCHEPLPQVNSPEALQEKATLQEYIDKGYTMPQIKALMVEIYGEGVLSQPPASGFNLLIYVLPPAIVVGGLLLLAYTLPKWRERSRRAAASPMARAAPLAAEDEERLNEELADFR